MYSRYYTYRVPASLSSSTFIVTAVNCWLVMYRGKIIRHDIIRSTKWVGFGHQVIGTTSRLPGTAAAAHQYAYFNRPLRIVTLRQNVRQQNRRNTAMQQHCCLLCSSSVMGALHLYLLPVLLLWTATSTAVHRPVVFLLCLNMFESARYCCCCCCCLGLSCCIEPYFKFTDTRITCNTGTRCKIY